MKSANQLRKELQKEQEEAAIRKAERDKKWEEERPQREAKYLEDTLQEIAKKIEENKAKGSCNHYLHHSMEDWIKKLIHKLRSKGFTVAATEQWSHPFRSYGDGEYEEDTSQPRNVPSVSLLINW